MISYLLILLPGLSEVDPCTQGGSDGFDGSLYVSLYLVFLFSICIFPIFKFSPKFWRLGYFHIFTSIYYLFKLPNYFYFVTIKGLHICNGHHLWNDFKNINTLTYGKSEFSHRIFAIVLLISLIYILLTMFYSRKYNKLRQDF
ncbi:hypothetical protein [Leptospira sp. GIMC2001]|uniref:hypothetical protein n=1 Tax=Leptospira sp. GIMC2001 TaxID=1513297 RepID=UPI00234B1E93|nr:hypothetical protein [Leptospira sp. GIMC2001]WCL50697.1 hypothetical protein O4O04_07775 [Leptospira sp. GIMC2001]